MTVWFTRHYGAGPMHLVGHLIAFLVAGWAITQILGGGDIINWIAWFVGAALLHDLVLLPVYSLLDSGLGFAHRRGAQSPRRIPAINHLRVPAVIAGVLLIVYFPLILGLSRRNYLHDTGHHLAGYTRNWLLICAGLFLASAIVYVARAARRRRTGGAGGSATPPPRREQPTDRPEPTP